MDGGQAGEAIVISGALPQGQGTEFVVADNAVHQVPKLWFKLVATGQVDQINPQLPDKPFTGGGRFHCFLPLFSLNGQAGERDNGGQVFQLLFIRIAGVMAEYGDNAQQFVPLADNGLRPGRQKAEVCHHSGVALPAVVTKNRLTQGSVTCVCSGTDGGATVTCGYHG